MFPGDHIDNVQSWTVCSVLLPHALAGAGHAEALGVVPEITGRLLNESGLYLKTLGEFVSARSALERALEIDEKVFGPDHNNVAVSLQELGFTLYLSGDHAAAQPLLDPPQEGAVPPDALLVDRAAYCLGDRTPRCVGMAIIVAKPSFTLPSMNSIIVLGPSKNAIAFSNAGSPGFN